MIDRIDPVNRLVYLDASTVNADFAPIDLYKEMRQMREDDESLRGYDVFMTMKGSDKKNASGTKRTERYLVLLDGTKIIPYDTNHTITITGVIISDDGLEGSECFDTAPISGLVNINYSPKQVEVITVTTNGTSEEELHAALDSYINKNLWKADSIDMTETHQLINDVGDKVDEAETAVKTFITSSISPLAKADKVAECKTLVDGIIEDMSALDETDSDSLYSKIAELRAEIAKVKASGKYQAYD
jgi:hypothetical protein